MALAWIGVFSMIAGAIALALALVLSSWLLLGIGAALVVAGAVVAKTAHIMRLGTTTQSITHVGQRSG